MAKLKAKKSKKKLVLSIIGYIFSFLCLLVCIYVVIEVMTANSKTIPPRIFNLSVSYIPSGSMEPTLPQGSYVLFSKASYSSININDIVVYHNNEENKYIIHRVIGIVKDGSLISDTKYESYYGVVDYTVDHLICKGDANALADTILVTKDLVYGKFLTEISFMRIFSGGINSNLVFLGILVIFLLVIGMQISQIILKQKADKAKEDAEKAKEQVLDELRKQVLEEELAKLKKDDSKIEEIEETNEVNNDKMDE